MLAISMLQWWWTRGWGIFATTLRHKLTDLLDKFSFGNLLRTLFAPFRQIDAGRVEGPLAVRWQAWLGRTFSRLIGAVVRLVLLLVGMILVILEAVASLILIILWPLVPCVPVVCVILAVMGVAL